MSQFGPANKNPPWAQAQNSGPPCLTAQTTILSTNVPFTQALPLQPVVTTNVPPSASVSIGQQPTYPTLQQAQPISLKGPTVNARHTVPSKPSSQITVNYPTPQQTPKQRVFTGTVTKVSPKFGFVDEDVFFQLGVVIGAKPKPGDRVLVEANYNINMPFKWNATRIQVISIQSQGIIIPAAPPLPPIAHTATVQPSTKLVVQQQQQTPQTVQQQQQTVTQSAVQQVPTLPTQMIVTTGIPTTTNPPALMQHPVQPAGHLAGTFQQRRPEPLVAPLTVIPGESSTITTTTRVQRERWRERERERERPLAVRKRSRERSPTLRAWSPHRNRRVVPRYVVQISKFSLDMKCANVLELRKRYSNLYVPSDFYHAKFSWTQCFPLNNPFQIGHSVKYHIVGKENEPLIRNDAIVDHTDINHSWKAKVMLMAGCSLEEMYHKCCGLAEDNHENRDTFQHPTRLIQFLVGLKGKGEAAAIGGSWSSSLDGADPDKDPKVLIRTAIRTTKALTGIDLSPCTQWYRFIEVRYLRGEELHKGKTIPSRSETVVIFLPDIWHCMPTHAEWQSLSSQYKQQQITKLLAENEATTTTTTTSTTAATTTTTTNIADKLITTAPSTGLTATFSLSTSTPIDDNGPSSNHHKTDDNNCHEKTLNGEESDDVKKLQPTHYSLLDAKSMKVTDLRQELENRQLLCKGLKSQLIARLLKSLKQEADKERETLISQSFKKETESNDNSSSNSSSNSKEKDEISVDKRTKDEQQESIKHKLINDKLLLPEGPCILVHPSSQTKGGKFLCENMSLSVLLDYRVEDNKEHSFEVSLFAELFNEMLQRDFAFRIYRALMAAPEKKEKDRDREKEKTIYNEPKRKRSKVEDEILPRRDDDKKIDGASLFPYKDDMAIRDKRDFTDALDNGTHSNGSPDSLHTHHQLGHHHIDIDGIIEPSSSDDDEDKRQRRREENGIITRTDINKKARQYTSYPDLLLAFVYFDQNHCGYLFDKDLEEMMHTVGLELSRAQVRRLVQKVCLRDSLNYRKLTDEVRPSKSTDLTLKQFKIDRTNNRSGDSSCSNNSLIDQACCSEEVARGNWLYLRPLAPSSGSTKEQCDDTVVDNDTPSAGSDWNQVIRFRGSVVDVHNLLMQLERSEKARVSAESRIKYLDRSIDEARSSAMSSLNTNKDMSTQMKDLRRKLEDSERCVKAAEDNTDHYHDILVKCRKEMDIMVNIMAEVLDGEDDVDEKT